MGIIICKKHGYQGFYEICGHLHDKYRQNIYREYFNFSVSEWHKILVCDECWKTHNLDRFQKYPKISFDEFIESKEAQAKQIADEWKTVYESINRRGICTQCLAELEIKNAREKGKAEPFPVFEKTLTRKHKKKIREIENLLISNLGLERFSLNSRHAAENLYAQPKNSPAVFVRAGAFTYPLHISIHSVASEIQQNEIIEFTEKVFEKEEYNQLKITFRGNNIYGKKSLPDDNFSYSVSQGEILREVYLNC